MAKRRGKYAAITDKLPKLPLVALDRQEIVTAVQQQILSKDPVTLNTDAATIQLIIDDLDEQFKHLAEIVIRMTGGKRWASEFAYAYAQLRDIQDRLEVWAKDLNLIAEAYTALMADQLENEGLSSVRLKSGRLVSTWPEPYTKVEDRDLYRNWCVNQGLMRQLQLPWPTTNALVKKMLQDGLPEPPGTSVWSKTVIRLGSEE